MPVSLHHFSWLGPLRLATLCVGVALPSVGSQVSGNFEDLSAQATSARQNGDVRDAIELYSRAVNLNPSWAEGWWFLGSMEYSAESYPAAQDALSHYLRLMPEAPPALALRGLCEFETRAFPQALRDLELAIARGA